MAYGQQGYGTQLYASDAGIEIPTEGEGIDLMRYLPDYYVGIREMEKLQRTLGEELGSIQMAMTDSIDQSFVESATWSLARRESELGLTTDVSKSLVNRREMIIAKMRGAGTTTPQMIQRTASAFSGGDVDVIDVPGEYRFIIKFVGVLGIPPNMPGLIQMIEEIKPAHLAYEFAYTYTVWSSLKSITYATASNKTWNELRTYT